MKVKNAVFLVLYSLCVILFVVFVSSLSSLLKMMQTRTFDIAEHWKLIVFGVVSSFSVAVYSLVKGIILVVNLVGSIERKPKEDDWNAVSANAQNSSDENEQSSAEEEGENASSRSGDENRREVPPSDTQGERAQSSPQTAVRNQGQPQKKLTRKQKKKLKLLQDDKPKKKKKSIGIVFVCACIVFCGYFSVWCISPNELCYHIYAYSQVNEPIEDGEIRIYRFYQEYSGKPYYIYKEGDREFHIPLAHKEKGTDDGGEYVLYKFSTKERYAKVLDCALKKFTDLEVNLEVYYYPSDTRIKVNHYAKRERQGKTEIYEKNGKIYSYKRVK